MFSNQPMVQGKGFDVKAKGGEGVCGRGKFLPIMMPWDGNRRWEGRRRHGVPIIGAICQFGAAHT